MPEIPTPTDSIIKFSGLNRADTSPQSLTTTDRSNIQVFSQKDPLLEQFVQTHAESDKGLLAYNVQLDLNELTILAPYKESNPAYFAQRIKQFSDRVVFQCEKVLAERYSVVLHRNKYLIGTNGLWYHEQQHEPAQTVFKRGVLAMRITGKPIDQWRNELEYGSFVTIMETLAQGETAVQISYPGPEGSDYKGQYIDCFRRNATDVEFVRFSSTLPFATIKARANGVAGQETFAQQDDSTETKGKFIKGQFTEDELLQALQGEGTKLMSDTYFNRAVWPQGKPFAQFYLNHIRHMAIPPGEHDVREAKKAYNAMVNKTDEIVFPKHRALAHTSLSFEDQVDVLGNLPTLRLFSDCGINDGYDLGGDGRLNLYIGLYGDLYGAVYMVDPSAPYGYDQYGFSKDNFGTRVITCSNPDCKAFYLRDWHKLEACCKKCGGTKGIVC